MDGGCKLQTAAAAAEGWEEEEEEEVVCGDMHDDTHKALHYFLNRKFVLKRTKRGECLCFEWG